MGPLLGRVLGDFVVREKLGEGGFGVVYIADQPLLSREAVIKVLHGRHRANDQLIQRFLREARLASRLEHPFAAHVYAFGAEPDGLLWIAMERVGGVTLDDLLRRGGPIPLERFVPLLEQICDVVHSAHEQGIVHRDLKPSNVMVISRAGKLLPKLLDFGIAKGVVEPDAIDGTPVDARAITPDLAELSLAETLASGDRDTLSDSDRLTRSELIGSPRYMAPEQWNNAAGADARTDLYALGVVAFEAITGQPPFKGTGYALAMAHSEQPVPPLPAGFPDELNDVFRRALAKSPDDRYANALELARAFRDAAGLGAAPAPLPALDYRLLDHWRAEAPQPIAEAVAALHAAGNAHQARDAVGDAIRVIVRYLGLLALAARSRVGPGDAHDSEEVLAALRSLRSRRLTDQEWLDLARDLVSPFGSRRVAHPIPELVDVFAPASSAGQELARACQAQATESVRSEPEVRSWLKAEVARLGDILRGLDFLCDYQLVVRPVVGDSVERWMGVRRPRRSTMPSHGTDLPIEQPLLLDGVGRSVVTLWPLMQVSRPSPGAPDELFLLDGNSRFGARLIAMPHGFERHDDAPWEWFRDLISDGGDDEVETRGGRSPYPGLATFSAADADVYFGRERDVDTFLNRLRVQPLLTAVGPSGAGKSSFIQAGVIPSLAADWVPITLRPGPSPLAALDGRLRAAGIEPGTDVASAVRAHAAAHNVRILLVVDQFEELFTLCQDEPTRRAFATTLVELARSTDDPVRVVLTLRDDFLFRAQELAELRDRIGHGLQLISTPVPADLRRIVTEPARRCGYSFEDPQLVEEMVAQVADRPGALALLAFTVGRLWELRDRHFKQLPRRAYEALGGVGGALAHHADSVLAELPGDDQRMVHDAFRHLVTADGTRASLSRSELTQLLRDPRAGAVIERLIASRLVVARETDGGDDDIEIVHEALIAAWPRLVDWRRQDAEGVRLRDQLRAAARQWEARGRARDGLWRGDALAEYQAWRARYPGALTTSEDAFGAASVADAVRGRRLRRIAMGTVVTVLAVVAAVLFWLNQRAVAALGHAESSEAKAQQKVVRLYQEQGRQAALAGEPLRAIVYLDAAYRGGVRGRAIDLLIADTVDALAGELATFRGHTGRAYSVAFDPGGRLVITAGEDGTARVWNAQTGERIATLSGHTDRVYDAQFSPDGRRIATASRDGTVAIWSVGSWARERVLAAPGQSLLWVRLTPDGARVVAGGADGKALGGKALLWDLATGELIAVLEHASPVWGPAAIGGDVIATGSDDGLARVWDARTGRLRATLRGHKRVVGSIDVSSHGATVVTASHDGTARLWTSSGDLIAELSEHQGPITAAAFSPDGSAVAIASKDGTATLWNTMGQLQAKLVGHTAAVQEIAFSPDGSRIATAGFDSTVRIWDRTGEERAVLAGHTAPVWSIAFRPDGHAIASASFDGTARLWRADKDRRITDLTTAKKSWRMEFDSDDRRLITAGEGGVIVTLAQDGRELSRIQGEQAHGIAVRGQVIASSWSDGQLRTDDLDSGRPISEMPRSSPANSIAISPDGSRLAAASMDGLVRIFRLGDQRLERSLKGHDLGATAVAWSPDGRRLASGGSDGNVIAWDVASGRSLWSSKLYRLDVSSLEFSPDGRRIASASDDSTAVLLDAPTGKVVATLEGHAAEVTRIAFGPDGGFVMTASNDGKIKLWSDDGEELVSIATSHFWMQAALSHDGTRVAIVDKDGRGRILRVARTPPSISELSHLVRCRSPFALHDHRLLPAPTDPSACTE